MKALLPLIATSLLLMAGAVDADAQTVRWESIGGPEGGNVLSFARTPDGTLFSTIDARGLFRSSDDGVSWERVGAEPDPRWPAIIHATHGGALLLSGSDSILRRSTDMGASWSVASNRILPGVPLVDDSAGGVIGAGGGGLYRSSDDGATWSRLGVAIDDVIGALAIGSDGRIVAAVQNGFTPRGVQVSTDMGASWRRVELGDSNTPTVLALAATPDGRLFAGTGGGGLFRSDDGGASWALVSLPIPVYYNTLLVLPGGAIVTGMGGEGIQRSDDGGRTWSAFGPNNVGLQVTALGVTDGGRLLGGTYTSGVYAIESDRWVHSSRGLPSLRTAGIAIAPDRTIHVIASDARFYSSSDNGASWTEPGIRRVPAPVIAIDHEGRIFTSDLTQRDYGIAVSTDRGASWIGRGLPEEWLRALMIDRDDHLYAGVERGSYTFHTSFTDGLFHSTDHGESWTALGSGLRGASPVSIVRLDDGTLFVGSQYGERVFRLQPGDTLWENTSAGLPVYDYPQMLNVLLADREGNLYAGMQQGLFRSSDRGATWQNISARIGDTIVTALTLSPAGTILAATGHNGVHLSNNNGANWSPIGDAPLASPFTILTFDSTGGLISGNSEGLYRAVITSSVPLPARDIDMALVAAPNPVGSHLTVAFEMPSSGAARLALDNALGEEVAVLLDAEAPKGRRSVDVDCSRLPSGTYLLHLTTARSSRQIRIVIVR